MLKRWAAFSLSPLRACLSFPQCPGHQGAGSPTFSLSSIKPSRGRDIDHWFLQSSKMMIFSTVDSIWKWRSGGSDLVCGCPNRATDPRQSSLLGWKPFLLRVNQIVHETSFKSIISWVTRYSLSWSLNWFDNSFKNGPFQLTLIFVGNGISQVNDYNRQNHPALKLSGSFLRRERFITFLGCLLLLREKHRYRWGWLKFYWLKI